MSRFRTDDGIVEPLVVELGDDGWGDGGGDVSFGASGNGGPSSRTVLLAALGVAVLVGGAVVLGRGGDDRAQPTPTTVAEVTSTTRSAPATTMPRRTTTTGVEVPYVAPAAFATDPGWRIYLHSGQSSTLRVVDVSTGSVERADLPLMAFDTDDAGFSYGGSGAVAMSASGPVELGWGQFGLPAVVGDGTAWVQYGDGSLRRRALDTGEEVERVVPAIGLPNGSVVGTDGGGRPVVRLADGRGYAVDPDWSVRRVTDGMLYQATGGQYASAECTPAGECSLRVQGTAATLVVPVDDFDGYSVSFSPAGTHAVFIAWTPDEGPRITIRDLRTGEPVWAPQHLLGGEYFSYGQASAWSPDGRFWATIVRSELVVIDIATGDRIPIPITDDDLDLVTGGYTVAGVL